MTNLEMMNYGSSTLLGPIHSFPPVNQINLLHEYLSKIVAQTHI